jgi:peptide/nickel transport system permease protein
MIDAGKDFSIVSNLYHLTLPALVLSIDSMSGNTRYARTAMLEVMRSDFVRTARAKGLSELSVTGSHAFRNALLPLITITTLRLPFLFSGALLIEFMFAWPGMGRLSVQAIFLRDYTLLMGLTMILTALVLFANLLADIMYAYADPRIRISK